MDVLSIFHPIIARWFREHIGEPTDVQIQSWQQISAGGHVLITAPTGSGKTLAAFLWAVNQLVTGKLESGYTSILYISPLRALNNDIQRNLLRPLQEIKDQFAKAGLVFPEIAVETRSGDTPQAERARMMRHPPEILITTPESLNLLITSQGGRAMLKNIATVILDEVHAVLGTKRGVYLMTAVERLVLLSGEFQRITLSATIKSPETAAKFVGGFRLAGDPKQPEYLARQVTILRSKVVRQYDIKVRFPELGLREAKDSFWDPLIEEFKEIIKRNRSTLLFANSRRLCERLALAINENEESPIAYVHHGSLSREIRAEVESRLREGELKAVIATNSLELGIDIGALDEVILIQSPPSVSAAIQRVGRAGHRVGEVCKGTVFPINPHDLMEAAVLSPLIIGQDMEAIKPVIGPLDVLAQVIIAMVGVEIWDIDALYSRIRGCYSYRDLVREQFDLVLNMLAGRYADTQIRELKPQISIDRLDNTIAARKGALLTVYTSGGVIPDRGYFHLRHQESGSLIGELDEEFVWEAREGEIFSLGAQNWRIEKITHNEVFVLPGNPSVMAAPFWKGEENYRDFHYSELIAEFLENANGRLDDRGFAGELARNNLMEPRAAESLIAFLDSQQEATGADLPHRHHILMEIVDSGTEGAFGKQLILHTVWGNQVNRPFAMALDAAWEEKHGSRLEVYTSNDCIVFQIPDEVSGEEILSLVTTSKVESLLRKRLETSGFFGARFRECAGRALLLPRTRAGERMPLWMNRLRSQKLLSAVFKYEDFPILLETWRTCLVDEFDLVSLKLLLAELESGLINWTMVRTKYPSPMARHLTWRQTNEYMYMTDELQVSAISSLREDLIRHVVLSPDLRPAVSPELIAQFVEKRQRLAPGYAPEEARELVDWVKERLAIPESEWETLIKAMQRDHGLETRDILDSVANKIVKIRLGLASSPLVVAVETLPSIIFGFYGNADIQFIPITAAAKVPTMPSVQPGTNGDRDELLPNLLGQWLRYYGPVESESIGSTLGIDPEDLALAVEDLSDSQTVIEGQLVTGKTKDFICDSENYEVLLRMARRAAVPAFEAKDIRYLPLFLAQHQGLNTAEGDVDGLYHCLERLRCLPLGAEIWESEILPARLHNYLPSWLDDIMQEGNLRWVGSEKRTIALLFEEDLPIFGNETGTPEPAPPDEGDYRRIFPHNLGRYDFSTLLRITGLSSGELSDLLWKGVWRGEVTNDTFAALRKGIMTRFEAPRLASPGGRRTNTVSFSRWKATLPFTGNWLLLPEAEPTEDILEIESQLKDRARILLERYGIIFRELLEREAPLFRWSKVFRALRLMELSGEVLSGYFFKDVPGPQFITPRAFQTLQSRLPENKIYWVNAVDPASICGVQIESIKGSLPKRIAGNHIVYHGNRPVVISERNGRALTLNIPPEDVNLPEYCGFMRNLLSRQFQPLHRITIDTINGEKAANSPYATAFRTSFDVMTQNDSLVLYRKMNTLQ